MYPFLRFIILLCFLTPVVSWAQTGAVQKPTMQFRTIAGDIAPEELYYEYNKQDVAVTIPRDTRSLDFPHTGSDPIVFYKLILGPDGKKVRQAVASVDLSTVGVHPLFMFFKDQNSSGNIRVLVMKEDEASFPAADCRFANFSKIPLQIGFGSEKFILQPNNVLDRRPTTLTVYLTATALMQNTNISLLTHNMLCDPRERYLIIANPSLSTDTPIEIKRLTDMVMHR